MNFQLWLVIVNLLLYLFNSQQRGCSFCLNFDATYIGFVLALMGIC